MSIAEHNAVAISATKELRALFEIDSSNRQAAWEHRLISCLPHAVFTSGEPELIFNPAGLTYYNLEFIEPSRSDEPDIKRHTIPELIDTFLINEGSGIAIEARSPKQAIDLSYGDILSFHLHRTFAEPAEHIFKTDKPRAHSIRAGAEILLSEIPAQIFPTNTVSLLLALMQHFGVKSPAMKLVYLPETQQHELVFSVKTDDCSPEQSKALLQKLGWFLPRYYSYLVCDLNQVSSQAELSSLDLAKTSVDL